MHEFKAGSKNLLNIYLNEGMNVKDMNGLSLKLATARNMYICQIFIGANFEHIRAHTTKMYLC